MHPQPDWRFKGLARGALLVKAMRLLPAWCLVAHGAAAEGGQAVYQRAKPAVLMLATLVGPSDKPAGHGSAFLVDAHGLAITNYHVVERALRKPAVFRLEARAGTQALGKARVLAFDVVNDLAIVQVPQAAGRSHLPLPPAAPSLPTGAALYALGHPLDLGLTITSGHYNGSLQSPGLVRLHYSGTLNPGMSGGPAVDAAGQLVGVNAARAARGEQVGFLVPIAQATALYQRALAQALAAPAGVPLEQPATAQAATASLWPEVGRQLLAYQQVWGQAALQAPWGRTPMGPFNPLVFLTDQLHCRSGSNQAVSPRPASTLWTYQCAMAQPVELGDDVRSGALWFRHRRVQANTLNPWQLAHQVDEHLRNGLLAGQSQEMARQSCSDVLVQPAAATVATGQAPRRVVWCVQPYRQMPGLYDVVLSAVSQGSGQTLVSQLGLEGVSWATAQALTRRFLEAGV